MSKKLFFVCLSLISFFSAMATVVPVTSTPGNDVWYYIKVNPRDPSNINKTWLCVNTSDSLYYDVLSDQDEFLWKVVQNGNGLALVNKKKGWYMDADNRRVNGLRTRIGTKSTVPATTLQIVSSSPYIPSLSWPGWDGQTPGVFIVDKNGATQVDLNTGKIFSADYANSFALTIYSAASGPYFWVTNQSGWLPANAIAGANLNHVVLFMTTKEVLGDAISVATLSINKSSVGTSPGQYSQTTFSALQQAIQNAQAVYNNLSSTSLQYVSSIDALNASITQFNASVILPTLSVGVDNWYYIQATRPVDTYATAPTAGTFTQVLDNALIPNDTQLWRLVPNGTGFAMQNKATNEYLVTDVPSSTNLGTQVVKPNKPLRFLVSGEASYNICRFWIENTVDAATVPFRLHAGNSGNNYYSLMNWTGSTNDNCTWLIIGQNEIYTYLFRNSITAAKNLYASSLEGNEFGQYSTAARSNFSAAIAAQEAKNVSTMSQAELISSKQELDAAMSVFLPNSNITALSSTPTIKWFRIVNAMTPSTGYASGKAMSSNGRVIGQKFTYEPKNLNSDAQLFKFVLNTTGTKVASIANKANNLCLGADGEMLATPTPNNEFDITSLGDGSYWIDPTNTLPMFPGDLINSIEPIHAMASNENIVNWLAGAGSASAWKIEYVSTENTPPSTVVSTSILMDLNYDKGNGPSIEKSFTVGGTNLVSDIVITPSANIQISKTSGSGFVNTPIALTNSAGTVAATTIYVRLKAGLNFGTYNENIVVSSTDLVTKSISCTGNVAGTTTLVSATTLTGLTYDKGNGPSVEKIFTVSANVLSSDVTVTPSANIQISKASGTGFVSTPIILTQNAGSLATTIIYVRLKAGLNFGSYNESVTVTATDAVTKTISCPSTVVGPTITTSISSLSGFSYTSGSGPSASKSFTISGSVLEANVTVTPGTNFQISTNNSTFVSTPIILTQSGSTLNTTTIYIRLKASLTAGAFSDDIVVTSTNATSKTIVCTGNVLGPNITVSTPTLSPMDYIFDNGPSDNQSFTLSGADLISNITVTPNSNFQISTLSGGPFSTNSLNLTPSAGVLGITTIYVRLKAGLAATSYSGNITLTASNAVTRTITCSGSVSVFTGVNDMNNSVVKIHSTLDKLIVDGTSKGDVVSIYAVYGSQLKMEKSIGERISFELPSNAVYIMKINNKIIKVTK